MEDLLAVKLKNNQLEKFLTTWDSVVAGLKDAVSETVLLPIFLRQIRQAPQLREDLAYYDRLPIGHEDKTYMFLITSVRRYVSRQRAKATREATHQSLAGEAADPKAAAPAPKPKAKGKAKSKAKAKAKSSGGGDAPAAKAKAKPKAKAKAGAKSSTPCKFFAMGTCKFGDGCSYSHKDDAPAAEAKAKAKAKPKAKAKADAAQPVLLPRGLAARGTR